MPFTLSWGTKDPKHFRLSIGESNVMASQNPSRRAVGIAKHRKEYMFAPLVFVTEFTCFASCFVKHR